MAAVLRSWSFFGRLRTFLRLLAQNLFVIELESFKALKIQIRKGRLLFKTISAPDAELPEPPFLAGAGAVFFPAPTPTPTPTPQYCKYFYFYGTLSMTISMTMTIYISMTMSYDYDYDDYDYDDYY